MGIYGNTFKPVVPETEITEDVNQLVESLENEIVQEATELGIYNEAKFHLFKVGDSKEYKDLNKDLKDAEQILNANNEELDVNKVGKALLHGVDAVNNAINAGSSVAGIVNPVFLPVALGSKLVSVATKSGKEKEALGYASDALMKLEDIRDSSDNEAEVERIQKCIDKLLKSKHALEVGKNGVRKEEKAAKKEEKAIAKQEKKDAREEKRALRKAARDVKRGKDDDDDAEDEIVDSVENFKDESASLMDKFVDFCNENDIEIPETAASIIEGCCGKGKECDDKEDDIDENDKEEVNEKIAEELTAKKESAIYTAFRALMAEATDEQIDAFLSNMNEATAAQIAAMKDNTKALVKFNKGLANKMAKNDTAQAKAVDAMENMENIDSFGGAVSAGMKAVKAGTKAVKSAIKTDKAIEDAIDRDEKAAYKENEKRDKKAEKAEAKAEKKEAKKAAKLEPALSESVEVEDLFNFVVENGVEITEDLYNKFVEVGLIEAAEPEFESYEEYVNYCLENGIQKTKEELEAIKESFIKDAVQKKKDHEVKFEEPKKISPELAEKLKAAPKMSMEELEKKCE